MSVSKDFKTTDGRVIKCIVTDTHITMTQGVFSAKYEHNDVNGMLNLHSEIMLEKTLKEVQKFINESREPEQLSLF